MSVPPVVAAEEKEDGRKRKNGRFPPSAPVVNCPPFADVDGWSFLVDQWRLGFFWRAEAGML